MSDVKSILDGFVNKGSSEENNAFWGLIEKALVNFEKQPREEPKRLLRLS